MDPSIVLSLAHAGHGNFLPFRPGIEIRSVYGAPGEDGPAAAFLRYEPGARLSMHEHTGYEHIYVLSGSQSDERGTHRAGTFVVNPPGSRHTVESKDGCLVLVVWAAPVRFGEER
jgi:anti-sigma factor ChrR (cupin superfamily)